MLLRLDELNNLRAEIIRNKGNSEKIQDLILDYLILAFADGVTDVQNQLGGSVDFDVDRMEEVLYASIDGKTFDERVDEWIYLEDYDAIIRLAENERERVYNTSAFDTAEKLGATTKTWHTMEDNRVRMSHFYLDGVTKPLNEEFHTIWGNSGLHPGGFNSADDDINCRCWLTYSIDSAREST